MIRSLVISQQQMGTREIVVHIIRIVELRPLRMKTLHAIFIRNWV